MHASSPRTLALTFLALSSPTLAFPLFGLPGLPSQSLSNPERPGPPDAAKAPSPPPIKAKAPEPKKKEEEAPEQPVNIKNSVDTNLDFQMEQYKHSRTKAGKGRRWVGRRGEEDDEESDGEDYDEDEDEDDNDDEDLLEVDYEDLGDYHHGGYWGRDKNECEEFCKKNEWQEWHEAESKCSHKPEYEYDYEVTVQKFVPKSECKKPAKVYYAEHPHAHPHCAKEVPHPKCGKSPAAPAYGESKVVVEESKKSEEESKKVYYEEKKKPEVYHEQPKEEHKPVYEKPKEYKPMEKKPDLYEKPQEKPQPKPEVYQKPQTHHPECVAEQCAPAPAPAFHYEESKHEQNEKYESKKFGSGAAPRPEKCPGKVCGEGAEWKDEGGCEAVCKEPSHKLKTEWEEGKEVHKCYGEL